jgi:hypothetical protein
MSETDGPAHPDPAEQDPAPAEKTARPAWLVPAAVVAGVLVVAGIVVAIIVSQSGGDETAAPQPIPAPTIVGPVPTPAVAPAERPKPTAFTSALPASLLQYAFASEATKGAWVKAGALEAVVDSYTDGAEGTLVVEAAQFATVKEATAFAKRALPKVVDVNSESELPQTGKVVAGDKAVGAYTINAVGGGGQGVAVWTNGTSVFRLTTAVADVVNAYNAYPL